MALKSVVNILAPEARGCKVVCVLRFPSEEWTLMESRWELASSVRRTNQQEYFRAYAVMDPVVHHAGPSQVLRCWLL